MTDNRKQTEASALRPLEGLVCFPIHLYRYSLAFIFGGRCRFVPSCSSYALEAVAMHGVAKGACLAARRFCRCHPWAKHGFDPVPPHVKQAPNAPVRLETHE